MMNRVDLIGRLTKDLEIRRAASGSSVLRFTLAVDRRFKQPGQPEADFISCVAFGKTAENMARYLHKGSLISVEGRIQTGSYVNQQGQRVYTTDVIADNVQFLEPKRASQGYQPDNGYGAQSYGNSNYGGGYQDSYGSGGGFSDNYSSGGFGQSNYGQSSYNQSNPFAQSVDSGFAQNPTPAPAPSKDAAAASSSADNADLFKDDETLDISSDDLPF